MQTKAKDRIVGEVIQTPPLPPPTAGLAVASTCWLDHNLSLSQQPEGNPGNLLQHAFP